jgi:uncharacterized protein (TIGR02145 family)
LLIRFILLFLGNYGFLFTYKFSLNLQAMKKIIFFLLAGALSYACWSQDPSHTFKDPRDGKIYNIVTIGEQTWMAENLAYLPGVVGPQTGSDTEPCYYVYGYDYEYEDVAKAKAFDNYKTYGVLYNWQAAMTACPEGWHLPSEAEWTQLTEYLGGTAVAGGKMKEAGTAHWTTPNTDATNSSGFTALPGGNRSYFRGTFNAIGDYGDWWSSTDDGTGSVRNWPLYNYSGNFRSYQENKEMGLSVRCVRD